VDDRGGRGSPGARLEVAADDGVVLAVEVCGVGPPLLCVHGFGGAKEDFADHVAHLSARATLVTLDLRGHGDSDRPADPASYSLDQLAADVVAVVDALPDLVGDARVRLLGHSMGGLVVRRVARARPERVAGVVFMSTAAGPPSGLDPEVVDLGARLALEDFAALKALLDEARPLATPAYQRLLDARPGFREFADWKWSRLAPAMWAALAPQIVREPDARAEVAALRCPSLVMVGEHDAAFYGPSLALAEAVPGGRLAVIPDAGHHPQFENPEAWRRSLAAFLDLLDASEAPDPRRR
jgi:pimeloyl-ACP methyl ester carboxylesterase